MARYDFWRPGKKSQVSPPEHKLGIYSISLWRWCIITEIIKFVDFLAILMYLVVLSLLFGALINSLKAENHFLI